MNYLELFFCYIENYFKTLIFLFVSAFALYFYFKKIGTKVSAQYNVEYPRFVDPYISKMVLTNHKDKTVNIWSIHAVYLKDTSIELHSFDKPLVLKPFETQSIKFEPYSALYVGNDVFKPDFLFGEVKICLDIGQKLITCVHQPKKENLDHFTRVNVHRRIFGKSVFNNDVKFILNYVFDGNKMVAFIDKNGFIGNDWQFSMPYQKEEISSKEIKLFLEKSELDKLFSNYLCYSVKPSNLVLEFYKEAKERV